jgi:nucleoside-diphosphate-sugar epimerase
MKILVTGATGFIGSAFTRLALSKGHQVGGMILPTETPPLDLPSGERMTWLKGTLAQPPWREVETFAPEVCVHFAWIATPGVYLESPENENYFRWSLDFLLGLRRIGTNHLVGVGTCIEYRIGNEPLSEERTPIEPTTNYARWKNALRLALEAEAGKGGFRFCWGRVFYPYGPGEHPARLCSSIIEKLRRNETVLLKTPDSTKDYIYIDDLAAAILLTVEKQFTGAINWGTGEGTTVREIAGALGDMLGRPELVQEQTPATPDPLGFVVADATRLVNLGWRPRVSLYAGLRRLSENRAAQT